MESRFRIVAEGIFAFILAAMIIPVVATEMSGILSHYIKVEERRMRKQQ